ncbi:MAG: S-ribosylhomocysteine lyase [Bacteroidales bacterium]
MKKIESFTIDHLRMKRGIFVSRKDLIGDKVLTTFDIRMKVPNQEPVLGQPEIHSIEHLAATFLRSHSDWGDKVVYWGPMGCLTGNYLILNGDYHSNDILPLMIELFTFISSYEGELPGDTPVECGNYLMNNLPLAKYEASKYLNQVLLSFKDENSTYPI